ncbi:hypothetical protein BJ912DRAFT_596920 [Pholiota molesta]|nr:hypothetical protein BJ912DRAFT_596920 [Pholiota molesta]
MDALSLSFPKASRARAADPVVNDQPQVGTTHSFIKGVSMPANAGDERRSPLRFRGGGVARDCCIGILGACVCLECCEGMIDCLVDILCCPCEMVGC